jgi:hypothetical protein
MYQFPNNLTTRGIENVQVQLQLDGSLTQVFYIVTPTVREMARRHFNCSGMPGISLEVSGGGGSAGAHWEKTVMGYDYMTGQ